MTEQLHGEPLQPDWISPPGETVEDLLEERRWTQAELAERTGLTRKHINDLLRGRAHISADTASRLDKVLGGTAQFWLTREAQYRAALERRQELEVLEQQADWLSELPLKWMIDQGWVRTCTTTGEQVAECLRYFGVAAVNAWRERYEAPSAAYRASDTVDKKPGAVAAWLRQVEREADRLGCMPYDKSQFQRSLPSLRDLTTEPDPAVFVSAMQQMCAACGVAAVIVPAPPGCPVHGATFWSDPHRAILALTLRYKTNDQLWFSFFHEAAHILKHSKKLLVLEGSEGLDPKLEQEADTFAADLLIPPDKVRSLYGLRSAAQVQQAARRLAIAPGIVVGRMQNEGWLPWRNLNKLKVRYLWT
jgi:HTH-type transcriptional regulator/antitoxin HigA